MIIANWISLCLVLAGALNWLTIGIFKFDLVRWITFQNDIVASIIFALVGLAGLFLIISLIIDKGRLSLTMNNKSDKVL